MIWYNLYQLLSCFCVGWRSYSIIPNSDWNGVDIKILILVLCYWQQYLTISARDWKQYQHQNIGLLLELLTMLTWPDPCQTTSCVYMGWHLFPLFQLMYKLFEICCRIPSDMKHLNPRGTGIHRQASALHDEVSHYHHTVFLWYNQLPKVYLTLQEKCKAFQTNLGDWFCLLYS